MTVDALDAMLRRFAPHRLADQVPTQLRPWLLPIEWQRERLWSLDLPRKPASARGAFGGIWRFRGGATTAGGLRSRRGMCRRSLSRTPSMPTASSTLIWPVRFMLCAAAAADLSWMAFHRLTKAEMLGYGDLEVFALSPRDIVAIASSAK